MSMAPRKLGAMVVILGASLACSIEISAPSGSFVDIRVTGTVLALGDRTPVVGATVRVWRCSFIVDGQFVTDDLGQFSVTGTLPNVGLNNPGEPFRPCPCEMGVSADGFGDDQRPVVCSSTQPITIFLTRTPTP